MMTRAGGMSETSVVGIWQAHSWYAKSIITKVRTTDQLAAMISFAFRYSDS